MSSKILFSTGCAYHVLIYDLSIPENMNVSSGLFSNITDFETIYDRPQAIEYRMEMGTSITGPVDWHGISQLDILFAPTGLR